MLQRSEGRKSLGFGGVVVAYGGRKQRILRKSLGDSSHLLGLFLFRWLFGSILRDFARLWLQ